MTLKQKLRKLLRKIGYDIYRYNAISHPVARMQKLLNSYNIDTVLDIGANTGQFAEFLRNELEYTNKIISFEPLETAFKLLQSKAESDQLWDTFNIALGDVEKRDEINVSGNSYSSSMLDMLPSHSRENPDSEYLGTEEIKIRRLDSIFTDLCIREDNIYMKIDTQGFEDRVLRGAESVLHEISTIQMEMSLVPLYEGQVLFDELYGYMTNKGYKMVAILPGFSRQSSGQMLQVDGIFHQID